LYFLGQLQQWHVKKPTSDEPLLISELQIIKHKESGKKKTFGQVLGGEIARHQILPQNRQTLKPSQLVKLVSSLRIVGHDVPALKNIELNDYQVRALKATNEMTQELLIMELFEYMRETDVETRMSVDNELEEKFWDMINIDIDASEEMEKKTRLQSKSPFWHKARLYRITATSFYTLVNPRARKPALKRFMDGKRFFSSKSVDHGIKFEDEAFRKFLEKFSELLPGYSLQGHTIVGFLVNPSFPFCGASPDRLVKIDDELILIEIKCPYSPYQRKRSLKAQMKEKRFYVQIDGQVKFLIAAALHF
jgi:hypothetical protein